MEGSLSPASWRLVLMWSLWLGAADQTCAQQAVSTLACNATSSTAVARWQGQLQITHSSTGNSQGTDVAYRFDLVATSLADTETAAFYAPSIAGGKLQPVVLHSIYPSASPGPADGNETHLSGRWQGLSPQDSGLLQGGLVTLSVKLSSNATLEGRCTYESGPSYIPPDAGLSTFNKQVCGNDTTDLLPITWCRYQNPYIHIQQASDVTYSRDDCFGSECFVQRDLGIPYNCYLDGKLNKEDPLAVCVGVTRFQSFEAYANEYTLLNRSLIDVRNRTVYPNPFLFTLIGLETGKLVANAIDNVAVKLSDTGFTGQQNVMVRQVHDGSVTHLVSLGFTQYPPLDTVGVMASSDGVTTVLLLIGMTVWPPVSIAECLRLDHLRSRETLLSLDLWQSSATWTDVVLSVLVDSPAGYQLQFYTFHVGGGTTAGCPARTTATWSISLTGRSAGATLMGVTVVRHFFNLTNAFLFTEIEQPRLETVRTIAMLYTGEQCHLFQVEGEGVKIRSATVAIRDCTQASCFYSARTGESLQAADLFGEYFQRVKNSSVSLSPAVFGESKYKEYLQPSQLLWLAVAVQTSTGQTLQVVSLNEFGYFAPPLANSSLLGDPGRRQLTCDASDWWDGGTCSPRTVEIQPLPRPAVHIQSRFRSIDTSQTQASTLAKTAFNQQQVQDIAQNFLYTVMFVQQAAAETLYDTVLVLGVQPQLGRRSAVYFVPLNRISYVGSVMSVFASPNSFHMVAAVKRHLFAIQSITRTIQICKRVLDLQINRPQDLLQLPIAKYSKLCAQPDYLALLSRGPPSINDFTWYSSSCASSSYCPSMTSANITQLPAGVYTLRPFEVRTCEPGYFCTGGSRLTCPPGFKCPNAGMTSPQLCDVNDRYNTTCYQLTISGAPGVIDELACPEGSICPVPFMASLPAPPGYKVNNWPGSLPNSLFLPCQNGEWCSLGDAAYNKTTGNASNLLCPIAHFCEDPSIMQPVLCNFSGDGGFHYCPRGSYQERLCPAGSYCPDPFTAKVCSQHEYCEAGKALQEACPASYYCPNASVKILCPQGSYCKPGTVQARTCPILTSCPAGTESEKNSGLAIIAVFLPAGLIIGGWVMFLHYRDKRRAVRHQRRAGLKKESGRDNELQCPADEGATPGLTQPLITEGYQYVKNRSGSNESYLLSPTGEPDEQPKFSIDFRFDELGLKLKSNGVKVLQGVTGRIRSREVTAVMGPSGAGKSTFITTLCGKATYGRPTGRIYINEQADDLTRYRKVVGFVPQDDIMLRMMTVKEILTFHALMRLPRDTSHSRKKAKVNKVIDDLGLYEIRHNVIGDETKRGISGGQRKRVNIGMEMVADPIVLFLDEPTSGLDSTSSMEVCACLKRIAESGLTIVTVIHQPRYEIFKMFHSVLLLGKGGRTVYLGASVESLPYFESLGFKCPEHANPPDFFMDVISGDVERPGHPDFTASDLFALWEKHSGTKAGSTQETTLDSPGAQTDVQPYHEDFPDMSQSSVFNGSQLLNTGKEAANARNLKTANFFAQFFHFTVRALVQFSRDWQGIIFDFILVLISGIFLGLVYFQVFYVGPLPPTIIALCPAQMLAATPSPCRVPRNDPLPGQSCMTSLALALASVSGSLRIFGAERTNFWRESSTGVSTLAYYLGKSVAHMPTVVIAPFMFLILYYQLVTPLADLGGYYLICWLVYWTAAGYGYLISVVVPPSMAQLFAVLSVLFNMMFSGALPRFEQLQKILGGVLMYPTYISYIRWSQEAFYLHEITEYRDIYHDVQSGMDIYQYKFSNYHLDLGMIFVLGVVVRICAYLAIEFMHRSKRK